MPDIRRKLVIDQPLVFAGADRLIAIVVLSVILDTSVWVCLYNF